MGNATGGTTQARGAKPQQGATKQQGGATRDSRRAIRFAGALCTVAALISLTNCSRKEQGEASPTSSGAIVTGNKPDPKPFSMDGSSTVHPISESVLDLYASQLVTDISLGVSGTGGGFEKFCHDQTTINGASRPITPAETKLCERNGVAFVELPVAFDGVAIVVHRDNDWAKDITVAELKELWGPDSEVRTWKDVRASWPDRPIHLFGPGVESGTFDYFTETIVGSEHSSRSDYFSSEDDRALVEKLAADENGLAYFGLAYHARNAERLSLLAVDDGNDENGEGPIIPHAETVSDGSYQPLSRPLFLYVNEMALDRDEVRDFVRFYVRAARLVAPDVGYVPLPRGLFQLVETRLAERKTGSAFEGLRSVVGLTIEELLTIETVSVKEDSAAGEAPAEGAATSNTTAPPQAK